MENVKKRTSMSVREMGKSLGLGKTESYWLIKKHYFETITVGSTMRVMIDSFEKWYANQTWYKKTDGTPPGEELKQSSLSVNDLGQLLGLSECCAYDLIAKGVFDVIEVLGKRRITKDSFERWYHIQTDYMTVEDRRKTQNIVDATYSIPEVARILGVHRNSLYYLVSNGRFEVVPYGKQKRITKDSFYSWLETQDKYKHIRDGMERS